MKNDNPLNNFQTTYNYKVDTSTPSVCPSLAQATANPVKFIDYIGCHKLFLIFILAVIAFIFYSGAKVKAAADGTAGGKPGEAKK